jgi:hypothetical protein
MEVAHRAAPDRIVQITEIALRHAAPPGSFKTVSARGKRGGERDYKGSVGERDFKDTRDYKGDIGREGWEDAASAIVAKAMELAPDQRDALARLLYDLFPGALAARLENASYALLGPGTPIGVALLSGTMNPANIGGSVNALGNNPPDNPPVVSPAE